MLDLERQFYSANVALDLFERSYAAARVSHGTTTEERNETWNADVSRKSQIQAAFERKSGLNQRDIAARDQLRVQAEAQFKREAWEQEHLTGSLWLEPTMIHARAFLHAFALFERLLNILALDPSAPAKLNELRAKFRAAFPDVRGVRDSVQHGDERSQWKARGKEIDTNLLLHDTLSSSATGFPNYVATMANGKLGQLEVSVRSMEVLHEIFQGVLNSYTWHGPPRSLPT